jgi:hypothetical protein
MKTIVIINGYPRSGKDTFVDMVKNFANDGDQKVVSISSISFVWEWLKSLGAPMDNKSEKERKLAADVKSALEDYDFLSTRQVMQTALELLLKEKVQTVFIHMREPRSIMFAKQMVRDIKGLNLITLFVDRPSLRSRDFGNAADREVELMRYDHCITNDGSLGQLDSKAVCFAREHLWI